MKTTTALTRHIAAVASLALAAVSLPAADNAPAPAASPLSAPAPVHNQPDAGSTVINTLAAGVTPAHPAGESAVALPAGWLAVELAGPHTIYVRDADLNKQLDPKPGVAFRLEPKADAAILTTMEKGDTVEITGQKGRWIQFQLNRPVIGYIQDAGGGGAAAGEVASGKSQGASASAAAGPASTAATAAPVAAPAPAVSATATATSAAPATSAANAATSTPPASTASIAPLPRSMKGIFASTRRAFAPRRPYDYQLNDDAGNRYTYLDVSKLVLTEHIEKYIGRGVIIYGLAEAVPSTRDIVIRVETLQLAE